MKRKSVKGKGSGLLAAAGSILAGTFRPGLRKPGAGCCLTSRYLDSCCTAGSIVTSDESDWMAGSPFIMPSLRASCAVFSPIADSANAD